MKMIIALLIFYSMTPTLSIARSRTEIPLNEGWRFHKGDIPEASARFFRDSSWEKVDLPHTWNNLDGQDGGGYYRGPGWYRKTFSVPFAYSNKRIFVRFGAAGMVAEVYLNGKFVGEHKGGFSAFVFDITGDLTFGSMEVLAVKVDNTSPEGSETFRLPPLSADFTMDGGLYREVELIVTDYVHISLTDFASPGVFIIPKRVTPDVADVGLKIELKNDSPVPRTVDVRSTVYAKDGLTVVGEVQSPARIEPGRGTVVEQEITIGHPHLWSGRNDPYLYFLVVRVLERGTALDDLVQPLGLRFFRVDPDSGFFLNGKPYKLHGFCLREDKKDEGRAITDRDRKQEMNYMLDIGATMVRLAHYQHGQEIYNLCDRNGIVVWTEIPLVNQIDTSKSFEENARQQLIELIRQNYNHPSIFFWGIFNEILNVKGPDPDRLVKELNALAKKEDPTRPTTSATNMPGFPSALITDVLGLNLYFGWYNGAVQDLGPYLDRWHREHPDRPVGLSEYGAGASIYQHTENLVMKDGVPQHPKTDGPWHPEEYQTYFHETSWKTIEERPYIWFSTIWNGFDFASDHRHEGFQPGVNDKGLITQDHSTKKDSYYWYKVNWSPAPMVHITDKRFTTRDTSAIAVRVYSNAAEVELFVDGKSAGKSGSNDHIFIWNGVKLSQGLNHVRAVAVIDGKEYSDECWWMYDR